MALEKRTILMSLSVPPKKKKKKKEKTRSGMKTRRKKKKEEKIDLFAVIKGFFHVQNVSLCVMITIYIYIYIMGV